MWTRELGTRRMPGSCWYRQQPGLTRAKRSAFSYPVLRSRGGSGSGRAHGGVRQRCETGNMKGHRLAARLLSLAAACAAPVVYALWVRPRLLTWGATRGEATGAYPGDELIPDPAHCSTMATTLP